MISSLMQHFSSIHFEEALSNQQKAISDTTGSYPMSFEEFLAHPHFDWPVEWVNGQVFRMAETNALHHVTVDFIKDVVESFVHTQEDVYKRQSLYATNHSSSITWDYPRRRDNNCP